VTYRCEATTVAGFVQQLAVSYIGHGYWFYVTGIVPDRKDPLAVDGKLIEHYGIDISKWARARRKRAGLANVHYLRHERFFVLIATAGEHRFFEEEKSFRDVRRDALRFDRYSIGYKRDPGGKWHPSVRIHPDAYREAKAYLLEIACRRSAEELAAEFRSFGFALYAPVRSQLLCVLRAANQRRSAAGREPLTPQSLRLNRRPTRVFTPGLAGQT
jgi:hypothetical protein